MLKRFGAFLLCGALLGTLHTVGASTASAQQATLSISDVALEEKDSGKTPFDFIVTLNAAASESVTVTYVTHDEPWAGAATAGSDYEERSGTLTFAPGETTKTIRVNVIADTEPEHHEPFGVWLRQPVNASFDDYAGSASIFNDDLELSIADVKVQEGDPYIRDDTGEDGDLIVFMRAVLAGDIQVGHSASVHFATSDGTASSESDYESGSGDLNFTYGNPSDFGHFAVHVLPDAADESDETLYVTLSNPQGAIIARSRATITILDDEGSPSVSTPTPQTTPPPRARVVGAPAGTTSGQRTTGSDSSDDGADASDDAPGARGSTDGKASQVAASSVPSGRGATNSSDKAGPSSREDGADVLAEEAGPRTSSGTRWALGGIGLVLAIAALAGAVTMRRRSSSTPAGGE